ncbi:MAG: hypothetical protein QM754_15060 [Tepidisphaeraceae bacterium]
MTHASTPAVTAMTESAIKVRRAPNASPHIRKLFESLVGKSNIMSRRTFTRIPDALGSVQAMQVLLNALLPDAKATIRLRGQIGGGINDGFTRVSRMHFETWDDRNALPEYDAVVLVDTQPGFANSPLPDGVIPTVCRPPSWPRPARKCYSPTSALMSARRPRSFSAISSEANVRNQPDLAASCFTRSRPTSAVSPATGRAGHLAH